jgi:K+-transporting ATPase KdpF subunit
MLGLRGGFGKVVKEKDMTWEYAIGGLISLLLLGYLVYALLRPERF